MIWFEIVHGVTVTTTFPKQCKCEHCGVRYVYPMRRSASAERSAHWGIGMNRAKRLAQEEAEAILQEVFRHDFDPVPCPECGLYQERMVRRLLKEKYGRLQTVGNAFVIWGFLAAVGAFCGGSFGYAVGQGSNHSVQVVPLVGGGLVLMVGVFLVFLGLQKSREYVRRAAAFAPNDPDDHDFRLEQARYLGAVTHTEFLRLRRSKGPIPERSPRNRRPARPAPSGGEDD